MSSRSVGVFAYPRCTSTRIAPFDLHFKVLRITMILVAERVRRIKIRSHPNRRVYKDFQSRFHRSGYYWSVGIYITAVYIYDCYLNTFLACRNSSGGRDLTIRDILAQLTNGNATRKMHKFIVRNYIIACMFFCCIVNVDM